MQINFFVLLVAFFLSFSTTPSRSHSPRPVFLGGRIFTGEFDTRHRFTPNRSITPEFQNRAGWVSGIVALMMCHMKFVHILLFRVRLGWKREEFRGHFHRSFYTQSYSGNNLKFLRNFSIINHFCNQLRYILP